MRKILGSVVPYCITESVNRIIFHLSVVFKYFEHMTCMYTWIFPGGLYSTMKRGRVENAKFRIFCLSQRCIGFFSFFLIPIGWKKKPAKRMSFHISVPFAKRKQSLFLSFLCMMSDFGNRHAMGRQFNTGKCFYIKRDVKWLPKISVLCKTMY